jgi:hypothetical protein
MTDPHALTEALNDAVILLTRAWTGRDLTAFGADGFGRLGRCDQPQTYRVTHVTARLLALPAGAMFASATVHLAGYYAGAHGHVATDENAAIGLSGALAAIGADPACWAWAADDEQGLTSLEVLVDVDRLLGA